MIREALYLPLPWVSQIPPSWDVLPLTRCADERSVKNVGGIEGNVLSLSYGRIVRRDVASNEGLLPASFETYQIVDPGDVVLRLTDLQNDQRSLRTGLVTERGIITSAYVCVRFGDRFDQRYGHLLLHAYDTAKVFYGYGGGVRQSMKFDDFKSVPIPVPPLSVQRAIADFLDRKTAAIDALIEKKERLLALLAEKRAALIHRAVTKGLDPTVPMKDSGIPWIGEIPAHWRIVPLRVVVDYQEGPGILAKDFEPVDGGVPLIRIAGVQGRQVSLDGCNWLSEEAVAARWRHFRLSAGDLLISGSASTELIAEVGSEAAGAIPYTGLIRMRPRSKGVERDFLRTWLGSQAFYGQIDLLKAGATIQHFGPTHLSRTWIILPSDEEQRLVVEDLQRRLSKAEEVGVLLRQQLGALAEYRQALITAAVTGQLAIDEVAA